MSLLNNKYILLFSVSFMPGFVLGSAPVGTTAGADAGRKFVTDAPVSSIASAIATTTAVGSIPRLIITVHQPGTPEEIQYQPQDPGAISEVVNSKAHKENENSRTYTTTWKPDAKKIALDQEVNEFIRRFCHRLNNDKHTLRKEIYNFTQQKLQKLQTEKAQDDNKLKVDINAQRLSAPITPRSQYSPRLGMPITPRSRIGQERPIEEKKKIEDYIKDYAKDAIGKLIIKAHPLMEEAELNQMIEAYWKKIEYDRPNAETDHIDIDNDIEDFLHPTLIEKFYTTCCCLKCFVSCCVPAAEILEFFNIS